MTDEDRWDWRTDTAERPAVRRPPPPLPPPPSSARFPLYADEAAPPPGPPRPPEDPRRPHRSGLLVALAAGAVLLAVALGGAALLLADGGDDAPGTSPETRTPVTPAPEEKPRKGKQRSEAKRSPEPRPKPEDVAPRATAEVPATAPASTDVNGDETRYTADRMLDGDPATTWRMRGDGTGSEITFRLPGPTRVTSLGLVNGYAKTATGPGGAELDWYAGNRRLRAVAWVLDDGTTVTQELTEQRRLQTVRVDGVTTSTVVLRLLEVSPPGTGPASRDFTAVSEVSVLGSPAQVG